MQWLQRLVESRGKTIPEYKVDAIANAVKAFLEKEKRLPEKEELLQMVDNLCKTNLWNKNLVHKVKEHVFGEGKRKKPLSPAEELLVKVGYTEGAESQSEVDSGEEAKYTGDDAKD